MQVNYDDPRFTEVEEDRKEALDEVDKTYGEMISASDSYFDEMIKASQDNADTLKQNQQESTDHIIDQINQQKDQSHKDYIKEQSGAYVDWQKQSNQHGAKAEQLASAGLTGSGYSESSQVSMYNQYQTRLIAARDSYNRAVLNYDNAIKDARLQNNAALAEIAFNALQQQLELSLQGFQYKNTLILQKASEKRQINSDFYLRYQDVLKQINAEIAFDEQVRQFNENMAFQAEKLKEEERQFNETLAFQKEQAKESSDSATINKGSSSSSSSSSSKPVIQSMNSNNLTDPNKSRLNYATKQAATKELNNMKGLTYEKAIAFLTGYGLWDGSVRLLTGAEWNKAKRDGQQGSELEYSSYSDYLYNYLNWRVQNS